jgi:hypothetical protein
MGDTTDRMHACLAIIALSADKMTRVQNAGLCAPLSGLFPHLAADDFKLAAVQFLVYFLDLFADGVVVGADFDSSLSVTAKAPVYVPCADSVKQGISAALGLQIRGPAFVVGWRGGGHGK